MKAKTLADKVIKAEYGEFRVSKNTCRCMEICIENLGRQLYEQHVRYGWKIDEACNSAIDVQLYKIGKALAKKRAR